MNRTRRLKISRSFSRRPKPFLPLRGDWLESAGFAIGMQVQVIVREQCLVILPAGSLEAVPGGGRSQGSRQGGDA